MLALRKIRQDKGLTLQQLGELVGMSHAVLSQIETGRNPSTVRTLSKIATVLGVDWVDLVVTVPPDQGD